VPARYLDEAPHVIEQDGREHWVYEDKHVLTVGLNAQAGQPRERWKSEPTRFADMIPGCYDPKERSKDMLSQGVLASVCFPTLPRFGGMLFASFKDKVLADVCVRAWNDFILDEWCPAGPPGMFVPMVICQVWDPGLAEAEIRRCVDKGAKALCFVENPVPDGLPSFHSDHWDPIWRVCQETNLPVCMHIASSGFVPLADPVAPATTLITLFNVCGMMSMVNLLLSPVCQHFEGLQIVFSEAGIGWVPSVLERADRQLDRHQYWAGAPGALKPSEVFARNMFVCMVEEPLGLRLHEMIGPDRILAETDYPHSDTTYPFVQSAFEEVFAGIPARVVEQVSYANAERLFDWKMADRSLLETPEVKAWRQELIDDPYSAMRHSHDLDGVHHIDFDPNTCQRLVHRSTELETCGLPIGSDGLCSAGHARRRKAG